MYGEGIQVPRSYIWIRAAKEDFKLVKEIGMKETGILVSCSDYHIFLKLKMTRRQAMDHYLSVIRDCLEEEYQPQMSSGGYHQSRYLRLCGSVLPGTDETDEGVSDPPSKGPGLRYHGIRCQLSRCRYSP